MTNDDMDDMVEAWHESDSKDTIWQFMAMTREEYGYWVETNIIPQSYLDRNPEVL